MKKITFFTLVLSLALTMPTIAHASTAQSTIASTECSISTNSIEIDPYVFSGMISCLSEKIEGDFTVTMETNLIEDLMFDELDMWELRRYLEEYFKIEICDECWELVQTVLDMYELLMIIVYL